MSVPTCIASREDWDREISLKLQAMYRGDPAGLARARERYYPLPLPAAIKELKDRGLDANEDNIGLFCDFGTLRTVGRNYVFFPADLDAIVERMAESDRIGGLARRRKNEGISFREEVDALRYIIQTRRERAAQAVGVSPAELEAAIRVGGISDPAYKPFDVDATKAWFETNAQDAEYQNELQLQETR